MPPRDAVHPDFDGHPEREWVSLSPDEKLDWLWEMMCLLRQRAVEAGDGSEGDGERE